MEKEELMCYVKAELHSINRRYKAQPMPQQVVGARNELEFILDLLEGYESAIMIAKSVIAEDGIRVVKEVLDNGSK